MHFPTEVISAVVFILLANAFPYKPTKTFAIDDFKVLQKQYAKWEFFGIVPLFMLIPSLVYGFGSFFLWMNSPPQESADSIFLIAPNLYMWFVPATFLAFAVIVFPITSIYRLLLGDRYDEYLHYTNLKHGFDGMRIYRPMAWVFGIAAIASTYLMLDYTIEITSKKIILNDFIKTKEKSYDFKQVKSINYVLNSMSKDKTLTPNPHYYVTFIDGNYWNTMSGLSDEANQSRIIKYLAEKSENTIDTVAYLVD